MSVGVLRRALARLAALRLDIEVDRLVVRALRVAAPGPGGVLVHAGLDAGLGHEEAVARATTCFLAFSAFNLSDDLSDGDCDYLPPAPAQAVVLILHSLFVTGLRDLGLPSGVEARVLRDLVAAEEAQVLETTSTSWDARGLRVVTDGIAGGQWSAYLRVMWTGTPMEDLASDVARDIGRIALLADDITTADPRYVTLPRADRRTMLETALLSLRTLESVGTPAIRSVVTGCGSVIEGELAELSVPERFSAR